MDHGIPPVASQPAVAPADSQAATDLILHGLSTVFGALGRAFVCLDAGFRILHAEGLDALAGARISAGLSGRPAAELLGNKLFGEEDGMLRRALTLGERREGWGTTLPTRDGETRHVSVTAAPLDHPPGSPCDPRVAYLVELRPETTRPATAAPASEKEQLRAALEEHRWRRADAARALGMSRTTLWRKMREYGLID